MVTITPALRAYSEIDEAMQRRDVANLQRQ
jgi:hypothetical protein